jgi:hypothetical protein
MTHLYIGSRQEPRVVEKENLIMWELDPKSVNRDHTTANIIRPSECVCRN